MYTACMYVHHMCAYCPCRTEEDIRFSETRVIGGCELSDVLGTDSGPQKSSQQTLLTAEPSRRTRLMRCLRSA